MQVSLRAMLTFLTQQWAAFDQATKDTWLPAAAAADISAFNQFCAYNMRRWPSFRGPTKQYPPAEAGGPPFITLPTATGHPGYVTIQWNVMFPADGWAWGLHRSVDPALKWAVDTCIHIWLYDGGTGWYTYDDRRLNPGTYYYFHGRFTDDGRYFRSNANALQALVT